MAMDDIAKRYPCKEVARAIAEALAAMDEQPSEDLVLKRNYIERMKREKNPDVYLMGKEVKNGDET